jgi:hypothetical protein
MLISLFDIIDGLAGREVPGGRYFARRNENDR